MPRCMIDDGYTLKDTTKETYTDPLSGRTWEGLPVVALEYRPALNPALYNLDMEQRTQTTGDGRLNAQAKFIQDHLVSWDVGIVAKVPTGGNAVNIADITVDNIRKLPPPIYAQILDLITKWAPRNQDKAEKNSASASA